VELVRHPRRSLGSLIAALTGRLRCKKRPAAFRTAGLFDERTFYRVLASQLQNACWASLMPTEPLLALHSSFIFDWSSADMPA
jgi:hypothetical protein